jgi:hypothetical protein
MTPLMVFAYNHPSQKAAIYGELDAQGVVTFAVYAAQDSPIRGTELFNRMMIAFGDDAKAIEGVWRKGSMPSTNIDKVNELTGQGVVIEDAVLHAWTVTRARKLGFGKVTVAYQQGSPGNYRKVDVLIEK